MNLNRATIIGNLTRDPEVRTTTTGQTVASFGVATNHSWTDASGQRQEKAEFHNIVAWGKLAEICDRYVTKGKQLYIEGQIRTRTYEQDGQKKYFTEIHMEQMEMLGSKSSGAGAPSSDYGAVEQGFPALGILADHDPGTDKTQRQRNADHHVSRLCSHRCPFPHLDFADMTPIGFVPESPPFPAAASEPAARTNRTPLTTLRQSSPRVGNRFPHASLQVILTCGDQAG